MRPARGRARGGTFRTGLDLLGRLSSRLETAATPPSDPAMFDVAVSAGMLRYLRHVHMERVDPRAIGFRLEAPRDQHDFPALLRSAIADQRVTAAAAGVPALHIAFGSGHVVASGDWYRHFEYDAERARGLDYVEDLFNPCVLTVDLNTSHKATIVASTEPVSSLSVVGAGRAERSRRQAIITMSRAPDDL